MTDHTYQRRALILKKTKLRESDLIVTLLDESGQQLQGVAKGARKPTSKKSGHLELFNVADILFARGKNLDIITETRLVSAPSRLTISPEAIAAANVVAELMLRITFPELESPKLFLLSCHAIDAIDGADDEDIPFILVAFLLKAFAFAGLKPALRQCAMCSKELGAPVDLSKGKNRAFSFLEGGVLCNECAASSDRYDQPARVIFLADALLMSRFEDMKEAIDPFEIKDAFNAIDVCQQWCFTHVGVKLRSLTFFKQLYL